MQIDIREQEFVQGMEIIFGDGFDPSNAYKLIVKGDYTEIVSKDGDGVYLASKDDALNLIKAVQKAVELGGWG